MQREDALCKLVVSNTKLDSAKKKKKKKAMFNFISHIDLHYDITPRAYENFITLCERGYYNGVAFHKNIRNFMIQECQSSQYHLLGTDSGDWDGYTRYIPICSAFFLSTALHIQCWRGVATLLC